MIILFIIHKNRKEERFIYFLVWKVVYYVFVLTNRNENIAIKKKFRKDLSMLSDSVDSIKNIEEAKKSLEDLVSIEKVENLEHENAMLRATVDVKALFEILID